MLSCFMSQVYNRLFEYILKRTLLRRNKQVFWRDMKINIAFVNMRKYEMLMEEILWRILVGRHFPYYILFSKSLVSVELISLNNVTPFVSTRLTVKRIRFLFLMP